VNATLRPGEIQTLRIPGSRKGLVTLVDVLEFPIEDAG
jgi:hypothetical protein